jgi:three-Cys-motif partner protein
LIRAFIPLVMLMKLPDSYRGREQTFVKHHLLSTYLERLFMIIGQHQSNIRYVDCFSGPWQEGSEDLQDTSVGIALALMQKCQEGLKTMSKNVQFQALFIEKDKKAYDKLSSYLDLSSPHEVETAARNGEFFDLRESILSWCGPADFTFFFIDPTGWKRVVEIPTLRPFLERPNSEFLINFMYDFVLRTHTQEAFQDDMRAIFGYLPDTTGLQPKQREEQLIRLYRQQLKEITSSKERIARTASVPILYPLRNRTLYHLVYLTRHAKGLAVFMEASEKIEYVQRRARAKAKQENRESRTRQLELFSFDNDIQVEGATDLSEVKTYWLDRLSHEPCRFGIEQLADMLEETGWFESDLQAAFGELVGEGSAANVDDIKKRRRKKYIHFDHNQGERLTRLTS